MRVTEVRAAYPKWRRLPPADAWQAHFWQIAVRVVTDVGVVGDGYGGGGQPAAALGPAARLMVDCYLSWPVAVAARMAELLAPYAPYWFEDVATPEHVAELAENLAERFGAEYREMNPYDLGAVVHDWHTGALARLRGLCEDHGARIVISSDWRLQFSVVQLRALFRIHDLDHLVVDRTMDPQGPPHYRAAEVKQYLGCGQAATWAAANLRTSGTLSTGKPG